VEFGRRRHRNRPDLPVVELTARGREVHKHHADLAGYKVLQSRTGTAIRDMIELDARGLSEHLGCEMEWIADAAASVVDLAGLFLGGGDQFRHRSNRQLVGVHE